MEIWKPGIALVYFTVLNSMSESFGEGERSTRSTNVFLNVSIGRVVNHSLHWQILFPQNVTLIKVELTS